MPFLVSFQKNFMKTKFLFSELPTCSMGLSEYSQGLRIRPPIKKFSENSNYKINHKSEIPNPVVVCCQSTVKGCNYCLHIRLLKFLLVFEINDVFLVFKIFLIEKLRLKFLKT